VPPCRRPKEAAPFLAPQSQTLQVPARLCLAPVPDLTPPRLHPQPPQRRT
jgi:hypothetical protein